MSVLVGVLFAAACGEDDPPPPPAAPPGGASAKPKTSNKDSKNKLATRPKIEARVTEAERANIRHTFRDRDFVADQNNRDPFQSFVVVQPGLGGGQQDALKRDPTKRCLRADQFIASNYSYTDLRLVGIIAEKTQRRVLMMDSGNLGHIIRKGDCVGREKALVKDIGAGYITFQVEPDDVNQARQVQEHSVQLYPNQMPLSSQPRLPDEATKTPVVGPGQPQNPSPVVGPSN
ncbi:MAG: hypothetical protein ACKV2T_15270 [Kofleriaceae bacterium]